MISIALCSLMLQVAEIRHFLPQCTHSSLSKYGDLIGPETISRILEPIRADEFTYCISRFLGCPVHTKANSSNNDSSTQSKQAQLARSILVWAVQGFPESNSVVNLSREACRNAYTLTLAWLLPPSMKVGRSNPNMWKLAVSMSAVCGLVDFSDFNSKRHMLRIMLRGSGMEIQRSILTSNFKNKPWCVNPNVTFSLGLMQDQWIARLGTFIDTELTSYHQLRIFIPAQIMSVSHGVGGRNEGAYIHVWSLVAEVINLGWPVVSVSKSLRCIPSRHVYPSITSASFVGRALKHVSWRDLKHPLESNDHMRLDLHAGILAQYCIQTQERKLNCHGRSLLPFLAGAGTGNEAIAERERFDWRIAINLAYTHPSSSIHHTRAKPTALPRWRSTLSAFLQSLTITGRKPVQQLPYIIGIMGDTKGTGKSWKGKQPSKNWQHSQSAGSWKGGGNSSDWSMNDATGGILTMLQNEMKDECEKRSVRLFLTT